MSTSNPPLAPQPAQASTPSTTTVEPSSQTKAQPQQQSQRPTDAHSQPQATAAVSSAPQEIPRTNGSPSFPQLSASTEEILKRMSANGGTHPGWEAAREQVLQRMKTSHNMQTTPSAPLSGRGRGRGGRGAGSAPKARSPGNSRPTADALTATPTSTPGRGRGSGRSRGSGARGGKRKRIKREDDDNDEGSEESSSSELQTPLPTKTKSGRHIHRPTHYDPATKTPTRRRGAYRRYANAETATTCRICGRGHSPLSNMIVFCDGCNTPYHQFCHDPPIGEDIVKVEEREWFCKICRGSADAAPTTSAGKPVSGEAMSLEEKRSFFTTLPRSSLISLLLHATSLHPALPMFPSSLPYDANPSSQPNGPTPPSESSSAQDLPTQQDSSGPPVPIPKPGHGLQLPPESDDLEWLLDDDFTVFSHVYRDPAEGGGMVERSTKAETVDA